MMLRPTSLFALLVIATSSTLTAQSTNPSAKVSPFLGKWDSEATFASGQKVTARLECRWSTLSDYLICEQAVSIGGNETHQLTVYSCTKDGACSYATLSGPGARPTSGDVEIKGNIWLYLSSYQANGKTVQVRNTNEFVNPRVEKFKVETSDDGGATWKPMLEGSAHKVSD